MRTTRVLALDHYFDQDLQALEGHPQLELRRIPYQRFRAPAVRMMGPAVGRGLRAFNEPHIATARLRYADWLVRDVDRLYLESPFDVFVLPSDTFFYVRALPAAAHRLGIPVVVVQKETTISPATMDVFSRELRAEAPFVSDFMTVCSERQRSFWMRAGAESDRIEVTGQPRFDIYASTPATRASVPRQVLFLTYALDAYVPGAGRGKGLRTWESLRNETEAALMESIRLGACEVVVKCHPQQDRRAEARRLARLAGSDWNRRLRLAGEAADTRELIAGADVVVGFQTTALYEAVAARRTVIYAAWGAEFERHRGGLIRFDEAPRGCVVHAGSAESLIAMIKESSVDRDANCEPWYEESLGRIDGHATDRVASRLADVASGSVATEDRRNLELRRRRFARGLLARSIAEEALWTAATPIARVAGEERRVGRRRNGARELRRLATRTLRRDDASGRPTRGGG
jgi:hypothetical protein